MRHSHRRVRRGAITRGIGALHCQCVNAPCSIPKPLRTQIRSEVAGGLCVHCRDQFITRNLRDFADRFRVTVIRV